MPRILKWRAIQVVIVPESVEIIASSETSCESSQATRCGLIGPSPLAVPCIAISFHQSFMPFCALSRSLCLRLRLINDESAAVVVFASPTSPTSTGKRKPMRSALSSICTPLATLGFGRYSMYGKDEPMMRSASHSSIASTEGVVPSKPKPPVHSG